MFLFFYILGLLLMMIFAKAFSKRLNDLSFKKLNRMFKLIQHLGIHRAEMLSKFSIIGFFVIVYSLLWLGTRNLF